MSYILRWKNPSLDTNKATPIEVPVASVVDDAASLRFTGKGAPGYGHIQQENLMRLLENFADATEPKKPTIGQEWFDTTINTLKICTGVKSDSKGIWKSLGGIQVTNEPPNPAALGDMWFQRTGPDSGVLYMYTGTGRYPSGLGGWNQVWPTVETIAGREEYDGMLAMVNELIGPTANGGSGALGKMLPALPDLTALDAELVARHQVVPGEPTMQLKVDTIGADWDMLLAAAKYAVSRLDLPASMIEDISPVPFISDGRNVPAELTSLPPTDVRYPTIDRRSNRRFGSVTLIRAFAETYNVLKAAVANKYAVKGISGTTGTNPTFPSTIEIFNHSSFTGSPGGATSETLTMAFNFATADEMQSFLNSGGAIQATMSHAAGSTGTVTDTDLRDLFNSRGIMRFTADKTRVFSNTVTPTLVNSPTTPGLKAAVGAGNSLTTQTLGSATVTVATATVSPTQLTVTITVTGGSLTGITTISFQVIRDNSTYTAPALTRVFGTPRNFAAGDKTGSPFLV